MAVDRWSEAVERNRRKFAKMKIFLPLVVWIVLLFRTTSAQYSASRKNVGIFGLKHEVFFLNLEDGYFGCQVNESTDYLQLYELSKLCDGTSDCYMGSDELRNKLKCTNDCDKDGTACSNGVCLEGLCHCNDGYGGCNCQVPDENECKYRPCDVFAHCTNTLGSFTCTCFPGYRGDGLHCEDIDECQDPAIAARCVENAECCNLPAHFVCKCKPGFEGDGEERCTDVNECLDPQACGVNAKCVNYPGNYTCLCNDGFYGDPYNGCADIDECAQPGVCGPGAICTNFEGGHRCDCPSGFDGDARSAQGCVDFDECTRSPCGRNALCRNDVGSFRCQCPDGFQGDPMTDCEAACTATEECNQDEVCSKGQCINPCHEPNACGMNAQCLMGGHSKQCSCPAGFTGDAALECVRIPILCSSNADCIEGTTCHESMCLPHCRADQECALNEKCIGNKCMLTCRLDNDCFLGHICLNGRCIYGCHSDDDCSASETCRANQCRDPCQENPCGPNAACSVVNHRASCSCINGMVPSPTAKIGCVRAPALQCTENRDCAKGTSCIENLCRPVCANDQGCLNNERCDRGTCKPICRRDDDCRNGEVCQGQTCMVGCRSDTGCPGQLACVNQQCVDPCLEPTACGTNALCSVVNHRKQCSCPPPLIGDPLTGCRAEQTTCQTRSDCPKGMACYGNTCMPTCRNDQNCLADARCIRGTCRTVCNSDASCTNGLICENRICQTGCRTDNVCANNQACINKQCTDPCTVLGQCGVCSECSVVNHGVQCSCPNGYLGNPMVSCAPPPQKCTSYCYCDEEGIFCADKCRQAKDCACGQTCSRGRCRTKCNPGTCPAGQLCQNGACMAGCQRNADCPGERSCVNKKCVDPCAGGKACGKNAICQVADHQALCLCPDGFQGDPREGCVHYECQTNEDCELDKKCVVGKCTNPCMEDGACGVNAQCRVVNRQAQCSCTPGFFGNARKGCQPVQKDSCAQNPCGENTICREDANGYECTCQPGCMGNPKQGCLCEGKQTNKCRNFRCGANAICRVTKNDEPECYCPPLYPGGDPYTECTNERTVTDCRTTGCAEGECVRDGAQFICRNDESCANDMQCPNEKACIGGKCSDPCSLRGACGDNALCQTVLHRPRCSCPNCYVGRPNVECKPDPKCQEVSTLKPSDPKVVSIACETDNDCDPSLRCDASGQCSDPCTVPTTFVCDPNKKCVSRRHRPVCVCKHGFIVNDYGELICAPEKRECHGDDGCASNMACIDGKCLNPCMPSATRGPACPEDKACLVMDHKPSCICMKDCSPSLSICLRDSGCPADLACRNYQCVNPCETTQCADDTPCFVEDHKPICKFCPPGFAKDAHQGCLKEIGCRNNDECPAERSCINGACINPCQAGNPCEAGQECEVQNHEAVCIKLCQCQRASDCATGMVCDGCNCISRDQPGGAGCEHCPPGIPCNPLTGACVKEPPGTPKIPEPCKSDADCIETEVCYMEVCEDPCQFDGVCAPTATCHVKMHRPICTCPPGHEGNPMIKCTPLEPIQCTSNDECPLMEACVGNLCRRPCDVKNPCAPNAVCINRNHGSECSCIEGYHGNGFVACQPVTTPGSVCQYNEDCPPDKLCDRLNRVCINPCQEDSCGDNAECFPRNHGAECRCRSGFSGNAYIECVQLHGCRSDSECSSYEACVNGQCVSPCQCGPNALCDVRNHKPQCKCPPGYKGDGRSGCSPPSNPCDPNPCGLNAMCEIDAGSPVCFCPKGLTGNPFKNCIPEGDKCSPNPCGPNTGCRKINGQAACFCLPEFEGNPPEVPCELPHNPCDPSPCGPNTQCALLSNGFAKCTCLSGYIESPNTIRGCVEPKNPCEPNPCGFGAICDSSRNPVCYCPEGNAGNPFRNCRVPTVTEMCKPGPCGINADCYITEGREQCYCRSGYVGDAYAGCIEQPRSVCEPNPCGPGAECLILTDGSPACRCPPGLSGDPTSAEGCQGYECRVDDDCAADRACIGFHCVDPCPGSCGAGAYCKVEKHHPVCFCNAGLTGNPAYHCYAKDPQVPDNQCKPGVCGINTQCSMRNRRPICKCLPNYKGDPKRGCKPECELNSDCPTDKACHNRRCVPPCNGAVCGVNAECQVEYHTPMCKCPNGYTGDAFVQCVLIPEDRNMTRQPCQSSPCGPQGVCSVYGNDVALCDPCSAPDAIHNPRCRPQCVLNTDCPFNLACLQGKCQDPCPGSCGYNAVCTVEQHRPVCSCQPGMHGNPYERCIQLDTPPETCDTIRCGANTDCKRMGGVFACVCKKNYYGDPLIGCRPECVINTDCSVNKACVNNRCQDPCVGVCGVNSQCTVVNHIPVCYCPPTHTGDALIACTEKTYPPPDTTPCDPNPCGPNSKCLSTPDNYAVCSCLPGFRGVPPACQAECMINAECPQNKACINLKCVDPCPGTCGTGARCEVLNHNPICSCGPNQEGDPFVICEGRQKPVGPPPPPTTDPCIPSPCGSNSICKVRRNRPVCSCQENYIGSPPYCRPECVLSTECPQDKACINEKCQNPCANACGANAECHVVSHSAFCNCKPGFEGDAFVGCSEVERKPPPVADPCYPSPCAENALCTGVNGAAKCTCIAPYLGDPYNTGCRPECVLNSDCASQMACINQHCRDPCPGVCGSNAECIVANHIPVCECSRGFMGDPFQGCRKEAPPIIQHTDPCAQCPSNSVCRIVQGRPTCSCPEGYRGAPPACRPECSSNEECPHDQSCINLKCKDPCPGLCGTNAQCQVINHKPFCSCLRDYYGNPFEYCERKPTERLHPCQPSPCGPYSECREVNDRAVCSCVTGMLGAPPNCRPECETHQDCPSNRACFAQKCKDPCVGSCGFNAQCVSRDHRPECYCMEGFEGDPYTGCSPKVICRDEIPEPCNPSPCGSNAICKERNGAGSCTCMQDYFGDPYISCRPECVQNSDCPYDKSCVNTKCVDPCIGTCGLNAECRVHNHAPTCTCVNGFVGNPSQACHLLVIEKPKDEPIDPCLPSPCGPYSICRVVNSHAVCSCQDNCIGAPPHCRPECMINSECSRDKSCINQRCVDPCPGTCGINARCRTVNHNPICSCNPGFIGDPFVRCSPEPQQPIIYEEQNPCQPSPCGPNAICRVQSNRAVCSCVPNYIGRPPSCRPECVVNSECPMQLACVNEKCVDPCRGSCGPNAECRVSSHRPMCTCYPDYTGDPFSGCNRVQITYEPPPMPCTPNPCGVNAVCREQNGAGSCACMPEYFGDPYVGCRPECVMNSDCPRTRSCINSKCVDPCPGTCGSNAECHVVNHAPSCSCIAGYIGNPFTACTPQPEIREEPLNPCQPSPCGPNSICRVVNNHAVCSCRTNFIGAPPNCRPECVVSSECPLDKSCVGQRCKDPCPGTCGLNARCQVVNHNPICSCKNGFIGDPFVRCIPEEKRPVIADPVDPCQPSPCGPNSQCKPVGNTAACSCLPNYVGRAPNCRPECTSNSQCTSMQACINEKCKDPCPGSCGTYATCIVQNHQPSCKCYDGYSGDPYSACMPIPIQHVPEHVDPCNPSPCGVNSECNVRNNAGSCTCLKDYYGDPYHECRPECVLNTDCPKTRSCLNNKCKDPCPGMCGLNAECFVSNHAPSCSCIAGFTGNPSVACHEIPKLADPVPMNPCRPSPCGPYSECREINGHAVCSCQKNYIGTPPACRPECTVSSECPQDRACVNQKCVDPCPGTCGQNARCNVINHNPICSCSPGFTGDPFVRCLPEEKDLEPKVPDNPCLPNPCGPNSQCRAVGSVPACSCLPNYIGRAPNCRPECSINSECAGNLACINEKCRDPCPGSCGPNAICNVIKHSPVCSCSSGYTGDPFSGCMITPQPPIRDERQDPCNPSPCGSNAVCKERNGAGSCTCLPEYFGDPYSGCRPECVTNSDCSRNKACVNNKCKDPCPGVCGLNAECYVVNHSPSCTCISGFTGDPLSACHEPVPPRPNEPINPCSPSPCGPNSICREINGHAVCSCQTGFVGTPPSCRPECVISSECAMDKACINQKCQDPCPGTCGQNARCQIVNHSPICSCSPGFTGDPFIRCLPEEKRPVISDPIDPCVPSPCGPNSQCRAVGNTPACSCLPNYIGRAPNCRPECMINAECPANLACVNEKCKDPCVGSCGLNAICTVIKHNPVCECQAGFTGDPFSVCTEFIHRDPPLPVNPCNPSPCGANAVCKERNGAGSCSCLPDYFGDPYTGCRPECVQNSDCDKFRACVNNKCKDPCPGVCGLNAECRVQNHSPLCFCLEGYSGDPATGCSFTERVTEPPRAGCYPSPCGPNGICREVNGHAVCSCQSGYIGTPPSCRPECVVSSECSQDRACVNQKCIDPCPGTCGTNARCQVVNHSPICSCSPGFTGDPFIRCEKEVIPVGRDPVLLDPCSPSPCGPNSQCRVVGTQPACTCQPNYIGRPPNCRPECTIDAECASNLACQNERCIDPCPGACGSNAICQVINHRAVCTCSDGYEGNPLAQCDRSVPPTTERLTPCTPSPCGPNAECRERNNAGACYCLPNYEGNPYDVFSGCRRECDVNSDCTERLACVNYKCVDPCPGVCGNQALCEIVNHVPTCVCPEGMIGDPFTRCVLQDVVQTTKSPPVCDQSTCGPNSICRIQNGVAICKCQPEMTGSPPNCRPECQLSTECDSQRACVNYKCIDPCPGSCGQNAKCQVINHNPICSCSPDFTGDPFSRCYKEIRPTTPVPPTLCAPSPCGPNAECKVVGSREACSCLPDYIGSPPNCRPECVLSNECQQNQACIRQKCTDPCPGSCGLNARCTVINHTPSCSCEEGYTGDPFTGCQFIKVVTPPPERAPGDPCIPSPCGTNARCRPADGGAVCECIENYFGNAYVACRPECVSNSECSRDTACIQNRCKDPCQGVCGYSAECSVINHTPTCTCPEGMVGNAFEQCSRKPTPPPPTDPCYPSPCGLNTVCRSSGGNAVCECLPDFKGTPFGRGCYPECTINSDCPRDKTCVNKKCVDPCPGVCGYRAVCHAINNSPVCSCPSNMIGDPFVECKEAPPKDPCNPSPCRTNGICRVVGGRAECQYPECVINSDCSSNRACFNQKCSDPCAGACGVNALCNVVNHSPICSCPERHVGSPFVQCNRQMDPIPQPECTADNHCTNDKACINQQCVNPCTANTGLCNLNAECRVQFHRAICTCREGYTGNAQVACYEIGCRADSDCPATEACVNRNCVDPCQYTQCGRNAVCRTDYNHNARCHCVDSYRGNPLTGCTRPECTRDDECPYHLSCQNEQCRDPCNCAPGAQCRVDNHRASCRCPPGYSGDASFACEKIPVRDPDQCKMDADCSSKLACFSGVCKNPCYEAKPCAEHAVCTVQDTLPLRTMYCVCEEGYVGDAEKQCLPETTVVPGCSSDIECAATETCRNRVCVNPCTEFNPCARSAECLAQSHKAICSCPIGMVGDPFQNCYREPVVTAECTVDTECPSERACINKKCQDPCAEGNPCAGNAECRTLYHRPLCMCPRGWGGDPKLQCFKPECQTDNDCPYDKACYNDKCLNPCTYGATQCGRDAECMPQGHRANCICPPGTQGNPLISCVTGLCQYNEDCADHEACDRLNRVCRPVCDDETCSAKATCIGRNHQATCECSPGTRGNPYVECLRDEPEPECRIDSDCPSQQACINNRCGNPCTQINPCSQQQSCTVVDTLPLRTMICACPSDMLVDDNGQCKPILVEGCHTDRDCPDTDRCIRGQCTLACRAEPCGINSLCESRAHQGRCTCPPEYIGNPHIECTPEPRMPDYKECAVDSDCPLDRSCHNERCLNPCTRDVCGRGAICYVQNHNPVCNCPTGYTKDRNDNCVPPSADLPKCQSNSDCTSSETCVNEICANPCNCGQNADCFVKDHYPVCSCKPGYSGNAQFGCFKLGCSSDSECANDKQCFNGECLNPCALENPCALNAECYGDNHRAVCRCLPGLEGNPLVQCRRVECHFNGECPDNRACVQEQCLDPCSEMAPCAQNAICFTRGHAPHCKCPDNLPDGNPFSYCERRVVPDKPECTVDVDCPSRLACINNKCVDPCKELLPCARSAKCTVLDSVPVRTMVCECPELHVPDVNGECKRIVLQTPPECTRDSECSEREACINRQCRNPCNCGENAMYTVKNHRGVCSCENGYEGNPNIACRTIGCRVDSECEASKACINGNCVNPCLDSDPCGINAECYAVSNRAECKCLSGYRGNPMVQCTVVECRSNNDCPNDKQCRNSQCVDPCIYDSSCSPRAECKAQNHLAVCRCPPGLVGNPYVDCRPEIVPECVYDTDCPSHLACIENKCVEPCGVLQPCNLPARCEAIPSSPVRTMICICPDGYVSSGSGTCKPVVKSGCISDSDCSSDTACVNSICRNPCNCGPNAECRIKDHKPVCSCKQGFDGNPEIECVKIGCRVDDDCSGQHSCINRQCVPVCSIDSCGKQAECYAQNHRALCECLPGYEGDARTSCKILGCRADSDCPLDKACINGKCENPCESKAICAQNELCHVYQHRPECACPPPFEADPIRGCVLQDDRCRTDGECPSQTACIQGECVNPCNVTEPCGVNSMCKVLDTLPVRTMICECLPGYQGNAAIQCDKMALCPTDRGFIRNANGECVCPPGYGLGIYEDCQLCREEDGLKVDQTGRCVCALERGMIIDERGRCICPDDHGYRLTERGECVRTAVPECSRDSDCSDSKYCNQQTRTCEDPCNTKHCATNTFCNATNHQATCHCIAGYTGNPEVHCNQTTNFRTDFPQPEMQVTCQADGVQVIIDLMESNFNGVLYVKGHSKDEECRRVVNLAGDSSQRTQIFKVHFGSCGLIHVNGVASFILVIQKHPKLVTYKAQAYHIKCVYQTGEKNVTLGFNVQMLTTAGTIANTGPPPTCAMRIVAYNGEEINSAEIGDNLRLQVEVQPATIYGGFARSCVAKTMEDSVENEYIVTDENGCATEPSIFGDWEYQSETNSLLASFNAFKFPSSDNIRFQCNIRVCFGRCQPVNCHGADAYGKRRRRAITDMNEIEMLLNRTRRASSGSSSSNTALASDDTLGIEGTLREEITIQSNAILTLERREERSYDSDNITPAAQRVEDICVSMIGLIIALVITALLALVAVAVAVSCWLMAYRRRPTVTGPLPHPPEFPNPLFAHHEPSEPSHDYMT